MLDIHAAGHDAMALDTTHEHHPDHADAHCRPLLSPRQLRRRLPLSERIERSVQHGRATIRRILSGADHRLLVVTGPCSIHDLAAAQDYAERLRALANEVSDTLVPVMRVYVEKPRTITGWKGLLNDPRLDGSHDLQEGLLQARRLMLEVAGLGLPIATETLHPMSAAYLQDLVSWTAIGARTTESQTHRELASGLPSIVGFKNATDGSLQTAVNAILAAAQPHQGFGVDSDGRPAHIQTPGNPHSHLVLRGGNGAPNYSEAHIARAEQALMAAGVHPNIMVDCSHENSGKDHRRQPEVLEAMTEQLRAGNCSIMGVMLESHLAAGKQSLGADPRQLAYGVSVTDACMDWQTTAQLLRWLRQQLRDTLRQRQRG